MYTNCILDNLLYFYRHLLGDELGPLTIDDLEHLEVQLDTSLKHIRSTRVSLTYNKFLDQFQFKYSDCYLLAAL